VGSEKEKKSKKSLAVQIRDKLLKEREGAYRVRFFGSDYAALLNLSPF